VRNFLDSTIADMSTMTAEILAWEKHRNSNVRAINWQFTTAAARIKLKDFIRNFK
jgi:hypothetical protein